jgi:hypothetical protein
VVVATGTFLGLFPLWAINVPEQSGWTKKVKPWEWKVRWEVLNHI